MLLSLQQSKQKSHTGTSETNGAVDIKTEAADTSKESADDIADTSTDVADPAVGMHKSTEGCGEECGVSPSSKADGTMEDATDATSGATEGGVVRVKNGETSTGEDLAPEDSSVDRTSENGVREGAASNGDEATSMNETEGSVLNDNDDTTTTTTTTSATGPVDDVNDNCTEENSSNNDNDDVMGEDSVKSCASQEENETEEQVDDKTEPKSSVVGEEPSDAPEEVGSRTDTQPDKDSGSANTSFSDSVAGDGINLISLTDSPTKPCDPEPPGDNVDTPQSVHSLASSETETSVQRDADTTPSSASGSGSTVDKSSVEEPTQDATGRVLEESPLPSSREDKPVTTVASNKTSSGSTLANSRSQNSEHRTEHWNHAGDHRNVSEPSFSTSWLTGLANCEPRFWLFLQPDM